MSNQSNYCSFISNLPFFLNRLKYFMIQELLFDLGVLEFKNNKSRFFVLSLNLPCLGFTGLLEYEDLYHLLVLGNSHLFFFF